jgi:hypothetical protein
LTAHGCDGPGALKIFKFYLSFQKATRKNKTQYKKFESHGI